MNQQKIKPTCNGHESVLNAFKARKSLVTLHLVNGTSATGVVAAYDKYTISLRFKNEEGFSTKIFFKSAIIAFEEK